jgi:hypothetical protein
MSLNTSMQTSKARYAMAAGGATRSSGAQPNTAVNPIPMAGGNFGSGKAQDMADPNNSVSFYQNAAREGVNAIGQGLAFDFRKELGAYLGGLNSTGALRSGAAESGANDIMRTYADRVGAAASTATLGAINTGAAATQSELDAQRAAADRKQQQKSSMWGGIGSLAGAAVAKFL